jgi:hypothetical protein
MNDDRLDNPLLTQLSRLAALTPDAERAARLRAQCRAQLARRLPAAHPPGFVRRVLAPAIVLSVCGIYVLSLVSTVLQLTGAL